MFRFATFAIAAAVLTPACAAPSRTQVEPSDTDRGAAAEQAEPVTNAPNAVNQRFASLDEYLAFLERGAAMDKAWYREIRPGVYQLETGNYRGPPIEKRNFTREELMRKYGFAR